MLTDTNESIEIVQVDDLSINESDHFELPTAYEASTAVLCFREHFYINSADFDAIISTSRPVFIQTEHVTLSLEISRGQFRTRIIDGVLSDEQVSEVQKALNASQARYQDE